MGGKGRLLCLSVVGTVAASSQACLLLSAFTRPQVAMVAKSNMLIWNPESKTEHLVQSLALLSKVNQFDYLVPTPTKPTVSIVGQGGFRAAYGVLHPPKLPMVDMFSHEYEGGLSARHTADTTTETYIKNVKITTINAADILALSKWMEDSGYHPNEKQRAWLQRYVDQRWYITAFTVEPTEELSKTEAVRLSFKTESPVMPYFSAGANWFDKVRQELYLISPTPLTGVVGRKTAWKGKDLSHAYLTTTSAQVLVKQLHLNKSDIPAKSWVNWYLETGAIADTTDDITFVAPSKKLVTKSSKVRQPH